MTIAGSDSGGGAGIQADLKTFQALGVYGTSALTAITAQNTLQVRAVHEIPVDIVAAQIDAVMDDIGVDAAKTGMLSSAEIIGTVAERVRYWRLDRLVVDPVMVSKSGDRLLREDAVHALVRDLLPLALVLTPNLPEAEVLVGRSLEYRRRDPSGRARDSGAGTESSRHEGWPSPGRSRRPAVRRADVPRVQLGALRHA